MAEIVEKVLLKRVINGQTITAIFDAASKIVTMRYEGLAAQDLTKVSKDVKDAINIERMKFSDEVTKLRSKENPESEFLKRDIANVSKMMAADPTYGSRLKLKPILVGQWGGKGNEMTAEEAAAETSKLAKKYNIDVDKAEPNTQTAKEPVVVPSNKSESVSAAAPQRDNQADKETASTVTSSNYVALPALEKENEYIKSVEHNVKTALNEPAKNDAERLMNVARKGYNGFLEYEQKGTDNPVLQRSHAELQKAFPKITVPPNLMSMGWCDLYLWLAFKDMKKATGNDAFTPPSGNSWFEFGRSVSKSQGRESDIIITNSGDGNHTAFIERRAKGGYYIYGNLNNGVGSKFISDDNVLAVRRGGWNTDGASRIPDNVA